MVENQEWPPANGQRIAVQQLTESTANNRLSELGNDPSPAGPEMAAVLTQTLPVALGEALSKRVPFSHAQSPD